MRYVGGRIRVKGRGGGSLNDAVPVFSKFSTDTLLSIFRYSDFEDFLVQAHLENTLRRQRKSANK